jgi:type VI protein secretion system component Hcp
MRKPAALTLITMLAVVAAGAMTSADAKSAGAKKGTKGTQQQYLQIKLQDAYISNTRSAPSSPRNPSASGVSRSSR